MAPALRIPGERPQDCLDLPGNLPDVRDEGFRRKTQHMFHGGQRISVKVDRRRYGKEVTVIEGLNPTDIDLEDLSKYMKGRLACGGTVKGTSIELQGNHKDRVKELLVSKGYSVDNIN